MRTVFYAVYCLTRFHCFVSVDRRSSMSDEDVEIVTVRETVDPPRPTE